jgi:hypothetical protein
MIRRAALTQASARIAASRGALGLRARHQLAAALGQIFFARLP